MAPSCDLRAVFVSFVLKYSNTNNSKVNHKGHNIAGTRPDREVRRFEDTIWLVGMDARPSGHGVNNLSKSSRQAFAVCEIEAAFKALIISVDARRDAA